LAHGVSPSIGIDPLKDILINQGKLNPETESLTTWQTAAKLWPKAGFAASGFRLGLFQHKAL
jgi:hypothetical protein